VPKECLFYIGFPLTQRTILNSVCPVIGDLLTQNTEILDY